MPILVKGPADYLMSDGSFDEEVVRPAGKAVDVARVAIMDPEGNLLPAGERGEIVVRSSMVMQGYYKKPEETAAVSTFGWHHTTDVGVQRLTRLRHDRGSHEGHDRHRRLQCIPGRD